MAIKIENKRVDSVKAVSKEAYSDFLNALKTMRVGTSFTLSSVSSSHRNVTSACPILLGKSFTIRKEGKGYRVGRTA